MTRRVLVGVLVAGAALCAAIIAHPAPGKRPSSGASSPTTIEPTLPLIVDLHVEAVGHGRGGGTARLVADLQTDEAIDEVSLALDLAPGTETSADPWRGLPPLRLQAGERRHYVIPLRTAFGGPQPVTVAGTYRLADGRVLAVRQGLTLRTMPEARFERDHLGAHEMMAVPLGDLPQ